MVTLFYPVAPDRAFGLICPHDPVVDRCSIVTTRPHYYLLPIPHCRAMFDPVDGITPIDPATVLDTFPNICYLLRVHLLTHFDA